MVAGALAVELARGHVDVPGALGLDPRLVIKAVGAGVASVTGNSLEHAPLPCMLYVRTLASSMTECTTNPPLPLPPP